MRPTVVDTVMSTSSSATYQRTSSRSSVRPLSAAWTTPSTINFPTYATAAGTSAAIADSAAMAKVPRLLASQRMRNVGGTCRKTAIPEATRDRSDTDATSIVTLAQNDDDPIC